MDIEPKDKRMSPLMSFKHIWLTQSTKVKDIYNISITRHKQKQHILLDDVVKENRINLLRERNEHEKETPRSDLTRESETNDKSTTQNVKHKDLLSKQCEDNKIEKTKPRQTCSNTIENKTTDCKSDNLDRKNSNKIKELRPVENKIKIESKISQNTKINVKDVRPDKEMDGYTRSSLKAYTLRNSKIIPPRPQTPKMKKSTEIRNIAKKSSKIQPAHQNKILRKAAEPKADTTIKRKCSEELSQQLLHPLWRRIPHRPLYGWSEQHARLESILYEKVFHSGEEQLHSNSIYYRTESEYSKAQSETGSRFLRKPIVSNVHEVLQLLACYENTPETLPKIHLSEEKDDESEDVESGYDADDE